ncbi:MAG: hypothetical protein P8K78_03740 [Pirellulales bacterium]|nr:hypothetical protein [Pirellulales bacterium]
MASAKSDSTAMIITLILFVALSIVLGVTTFIFHKAEEDAIVARDRAEEERVVAEEEAIKATEQLEELKQLVSADPVKPSVEIIMDEFKRHKEVYGETYDKFMRDGVRSNSEEENRAELTAEDVESSTYPLMLEFLIDANQEMYGWIDQKNKQIDDLEKTYDVDKKKLEDDKEQIQNQLEDMSEKVTKIQQQFSDDRQEHEDKYNKANEKLEKAQDKVAEVQIKSREKIDKVTETMNAQDKKLKTATNALSEARKIDLEAPDGEVVWVNQVDGTVYVDLGRYDGLRRQTTFSVYPRDVSNALNAEPKGTIEIVKVNDHMSVAKVTSDSLSNEHLLNPILKGDKVISTVFHRGEPEHFAIVGKIDIDGDNRSDLPLLLQLIERNGGIVDAFVNESGKVGGDARLSPATKFLVMGEKPTDRTEESLLNAYNKFVKSAMDNGIRILPLKDLLDHMGYEGQGRSVGLGRSANPDDFKDEESLRRPANDFNEGQRFRRAPSDFNEGQQFRRRPAS